MKQFKHSLIVAFSFGFLACDPTPKSTTAQSPTTLSESSTAQSLADSHDLLDVLQGRWQSEQDATYFLEISGSQMRHFNGGKLTQETEIEVDAACRSTACTSDSTATLSGWCFVEKGQYDAQCCVVTKCDSTRLQYRAIGTAGSGLAFRKKTE